MYRSSFTLESIDLTTDKHIWGNTDRFQMAFSGDVSDEMRHFAEANRLNTTTMECLLKQGFINVDDIMQLSGSDFFDLGLLRAQAYRLRNAVEKNLKNEPVYAETLVTEASTGVTSIAGQLEMNDLLGTGFFGTVYRATLHEKSTATESHLVAKTIIDDFEDQDVKRVLYDVDSMKKFHHKNIIEVIGVITHEEIWYILYEYVTAGNLRDFIADPKKDITLCELLDLGLQVASGMIYLSKKNCVHGNLAARNCLITNGETVKVSDFGIVPNLLSNQYTMSRPLPVKWMALEVITKRLYTLKSDVWSFGVLLWELLTRGRKPYENCSSIEVKDMLKHGKRLAKPTVLSTEHELYLEIQRCWDNEPGGRPGIEEIYEHLKKTCAKFDYDKLSGDEDSEYTAPAVTHTPPENTFVPAPRTSVPLPAPPPSEVRTDASECRDAEVQYARFNPTRSIADTSATLLHGRILIHVNDDYIEEAVTEMSKKYHFPIFKATDVRQRDRIATGQSHLTTTAGQIILADEVYETEVFLQEPAKASKTMYMMNALEYLARLKHENVMTILGVVMLANNPNIVLKRTASLWYSIREMPGRVPIKDLLSYAYDVAKGLSYIHEKEIILADGPTTRTCWVDYGHAVIGGFALAHELHKRPGPDFFNSARFSNKWMSVEWYRGASDAYEFSVDSDNACSLPSDMWIFGVFLWELLSRGELPYPDLNPEVIGEEIRRGYRMKPPQDCPSQLGQMMTRCWRENAVERPTAGDFCHLLKSMIENYDENSYMNTDALVYDDVDDDPYTVAEEDEYEYVDQL